MGPILFEPHVNFDLVGASFRNNCVYYSQRQVWEYVEGEESTHPWCNAYDLECSPHLCIVRLCGATILQIGITFFLIEDNASINSKHSYRYRDNVPSLLRELFKCGKLPSLSISNSEIASSIVHSAKSELVFAVAYIEIITTRVVLIVLYNVNDAITPFMINHPCVTSWPIVWADL